MSTMEQERSEPLFPNLDADGDGGLTEIESLCLACMQQGVTRLLLTRIPFFKEVIISSFNCDHCGYNNRDIQFGGMIQEKGVQIKLHVNQPKDLNRQVVKSDFAAWSIPEVDFEKPSNKKGEISTIEGLLSTVIESLKQMRKTTPGTNISEVDPQQQKIDEFVERLENLKTFKTSPFTLCIDDPSGNSYIENPYAPKKDENMTLQNYTRSREQEIALGLLADDDGEEEEEEEAQNTEQASTEVPPNLEAEEVISFRVNCPNCNAPCESNMRMVDIPFFKQVVLMATVCAVCGHRDNEVKSSAGIADKGVRHVLRITDPSDLNRDVLKSDTCAVRIPELQLDLEEGTLGGRFTTLEGLLINMRDQLSGQNPFILGDSSDGDAKEQMKYFLSRLEKVIKGETLNITFILDDPAGNSYLQNTYAPDEDPELKVESYERTSEQNDSLGLTDMKTENYS